MDVRSEEARKGQGIRDKKDKKIRR